MGRGTRNKCQRDAQQGKPNFQQCKNRADTAPAIRKVKPSLGVSTLLLWDVVDRKMSHLVYSIF